MFLVSVIGLMSYNHTKNIAHMTKIIHNQSVQLQSIIDSIQENEYKNISDSNKYMYNVYNHNNSFAAMKSSTNKPIELGNQAQEFNMMKQYQTAE